MNWPEFRRAFRLPLGKRAVKGEVAAELEFHLQGRIEELMAAGLSRTEAEREARARFGDLPRIGAELERIDREMVRRRSLAEWLEGWRRDLRQAFRSLRRTPGFTAVAVLTLGLGIGANTAIFSVVDGVLLRPAPFQEMDRLVMVWQTDRKSGTLREPASLPDYFDLQRESRRLDRLAGFVPAEITLTPDDGEPSRVATLLMTHGLLPMLGITPLAGRGFTPEEDRPGAPRVVLIGEELWERLFLRDPAITNKSLRLNDIPHAIVGVLPASADFGTLQILGAAAYGRGFADRGGPARVDAWLPLRPNPTPESRGTHPLLMVGRLGAGVGLEPAQEELTTLAAGLERTYAQSNDGRGIFLEALPEVVFGPVRPALLVLLGAVALVLLVACANVANLLLARATTRMREVTVRAALGASGRRLAAQFFAESALLTGAGVILGLGLAVVGLRALMGMAPSDIPRVGSIGIDARVLGVTMAVAAGVGLLFGILPMLQLRGGNIQSLLQGERGSSAGKRHRRLRSALVMAELALAVMLMAGAGLLIRSFWRLHQVDPGFAAERVLKAEFELPRSRYSRRIEAQRFADELRRRVSALPGVVSVAIAGSHPLDAGFTSSIVVPGREAEAADWPEPSIRRVDAGYFRTVGGTLVAGRFFDASDDVEAAPVLLINEAAGAQFFRGTNPLGQRISLWGAQRTVVGVVGNERIHGLVAATPPAVYMPVTQEPVSGGSLLVRVRGNPAGLAPAVRATVRELDPGLALFGVEPLGETLSNSLGQRRFTMVVLGAFAAVSLLLAVIGVHGVLSYTVAQRTREIGIRMALGADQGNVRTLVVGQGAVLAGAGLAIGLLGAFALTRVLGTLLYGVGATDPVTFGAVALLLGGVALLASYFPARKATRVSPVEALREE
ncbi:MAG TPA: ABC transporter permease [Gemmatimonadales bacterium]|nr:ABC transporter permease [Gemmatimonadales bacterium]